jgi:3-isopropylmalate/(R)-2-methylmalate dehydratase small subunit
MNKPLKYIKSSAVPLPMENVDTDQIIPARFLKAVDMSGFGENLFRDWRYHKNGAENAQFVLNNKVYGGEILLSGKNFGCGSSREHAAWAIAQYGFKAVVSSYFADIFKNNALNNGLLVVEVSDEFLAYMFEIVEQQPRAQFIIDIERQEVRLPHEKAIFHFELDPYKKECLITGKDDMDYLISLNQKVKDFEFNQIIF